MAYEKYCVWFADVHNFFMLLAIVGARGETPSGDAEHDKVAGKGLNVGNLKTFLSQTCIQVKHNLFAQFIKHFFKLLPLGQTFCSFSILINGTA